MQRWLSAENRLLLLLAVAEATLLLDRLAVGFLAPFLTESLDLTNFQLGLLSSLFSLSFAISGYAVSHVSDRSGRRWGWMIGLILVFSLASALGGLAQGFGQLAAMRIALGLAEGPFLPIALSLMAERSSDSRRSFNLAFVQNFGAFVLAQLAGPIVLIHIAVQFGWRAALFFTAAPGVVVAALLLVMSRSTAEERPLARAAQASPKTKQETPSIWQLNILICMGVAACMGSWILLQMTFLPKYLVQVAELSPTRMSLVMSVLGIGGCLSSLALPVLSDRFGRRAMLMLGTLVALATPIGVLFAYRQPDFLTAAILLGSVAFGASPLYVAIIPSDSVTPGARARAVALVSACSAIMGGVVAPSVAGRLADTYGLSVAFWIAGGLAFAAFCLAGLIRPTREPVAASAPKGRMIEATTDP